MITSNGAAVTIIEVGGGNGKALVELATWNFPLTIDFETDEGYFFWIDKATAELDTDMVADFTPLVTNEDIEGPINQALTEYYREERETALVNELL